MIHYPCRSTFCRPCIHSSEFSLQKQQRQMLHLFVYLCDNTRGTLELTRNLTVECSFLPFRRFPNHGGLPATLISDNAETFRGASREIKKIVRLKEVVRYLANNRISWKFIVEKAPWWGGFWEQLIQTVKRCLWKTIGRTTLNYDQLVTLLTEVESVINSRPLTYLEDDQDGVSDTLPPSHLINGRRIIDSPNGGHFEIISTNSSLTRWAKHHRHLLQQFTNQWQKTYFAKPKKKTHSNYKKSERSQGTSMADWAIFWAPCPWSLLNL